MTYSERYFLLFSHCSSSFFFTSGLDNNWRAGRSAGRDQRRITQYVTQVLSPFVHSLLFFSVCNGKKETDNEEGSVHPRKQAAVILSYKMLL